MPIDLRQLQARKSDELRAVIPGESEPIIFHYYPQKLSSTMQGKMASATDTGVLADCMAELLIDWDLVMDGQPWPLTRENLGLLGLLTLTAFATAIGEHQKSEVDRKNFDSGSGPRAATAPAPIGSPSSA